MKALTRFFTPLLIHILCLSAPANAQNPYIVTSTGLGQYAYIEKDATTFVALNSNTHSNIDYMAARFYVNGSEWIYNSATASCGGSNTQRNTSDYNSANFGANWAVGNIAYVSVYARYCGGAQNPPCWCNTGYNERSFGIVDVNTAYTGSFDPVVSDNPGTGENMVGSMTLQAGSLNLSLKRFWITNTGTALETTDIPVNGIRVYYETVTGSETFDGSESFFNLNGTEGSNSATNQEWGVDNVNIAIPAAGLRLYIVVSDLTNSYTLGRTIQFQLLNDGISFNETRDTYNRLRVNATTLNPAAATLPVEWANFTARAEADGIRLQWSTTTEIDNNYFAIERSADGRKWREIAQVKSKGNSTAEQRYSYTDLQPIAGMSYYRIRQVDLDGRFSFSRMLSAAFENAGARITIRPNPLNGPKAWVNSPVPVRFIEAYTPNGRFIKRWEIGGAASPIELDVADLPEGVMLFQINGVTSIRVVK